MKNLLLAFALIGFMVTSYATTPVMSTTAIAMECDDDDKCDKKDCKKDKKSCSKDKKSCSKDKKETTKKSCCSKKDGKKSCSKKSTEKK